MGARGDLPQPFNSWPTTTIAPARNPHERGGSRQMGGSLRNGEHTLLSGGSDHTRRCDDGFPTKEKHCKSVDGGGDATLGKRVAAALLRPPRSHSLVYTHSGGAALTAAVDRAGAAPDGVVGATAIQPVSTSASPVPTGGPPSSTVLTGAPQSSNAVTAAAVAAVVPLVTATVLVSKSNQAAGVPQGPLHPHTVQAVQVVQAAHSGQGHPGYYQLGGGPDSPQSGGSGGSGGTPVKASACPCCFKSFFDRSTMKRHMKRHFADRETYDCVACSKSFTRKDKLRDHLKSARHILTVYVSYREAKSASDGLGDHYANRKWRQRPLAVRYVKAVRDVYLEEGYIHHVQSGPNALPANAERSADTAHSPSSASSPEHPGPSSDALSSLPQTEREIVRFMERLRTMGKLDGLPIEGSAPLQQLANVSSIYNGSVIGGSNGALVSDTEGDDPEDDADGDAGADNNDDRVPESVESPPLSVSPANESS
ncbi:hypothetical protein BIW11_10419 [Tropilaelaps mercedesae]|uniref:C2H2-type domain-containing protein n=1 Tax=Tropilaelaps mercedesae TaxID=418985 RepID=A0A1V9XFP2_9ACAR|nr:hypothetical protein BIW11_10419 [Tropilaelaps mercedesae]